jgi:hypothetical protein
MPGRFWGKKLDPNEYRDITAMLFPPELLDDPPIATSVFQSQFGVGGSDPVLLGEVAAQEYHPSGLVMRIPGARVESVWAPRSVTDQQIQAWRQHIERMMQPIAECSVSRVMLCGGRIRHRWELLGGRVILFPPPAQAPAAPYLAARHPAMLRLFVKGCIDTGVNGTYAHREFEWWSLLLNATTYLGCSHTIRGHNGWAWDRYRSKRSEWMELEYFSPELLDRAAIEKAKEDAPSGALAPDWDYYVGAGAGDDDHNALLPVSLNETLIAAQQLSPEHRVLLKSACKWIKDADDAGAISMSLSFVALVSAVEVLAKEWAPDDNKASRRFRRFLHAMLPCYRDVADAADGLYHLRCQLVHDGLVFPEDWSGLTGRHELPEVSAHAGMTRIVRQAAINWTRSRSNLPHVPH